jgi:hypothetical protein
VGPRFLLAGFAVTAVSMTAGCTLFVSFDEVCDGGACSDATVDGQIRAEASGADAKPHAEVGPDDAGPVLDGNVCLSGHDGSVCGPASSCHDPSICIAGVCTPEPLANGTPCGAPPKNECWSYATCQKGVCGTSTAYPDGYQWPDAGGQYARCCGGEPVQTTTDTNCGVCGIGCKDGESCTTIGGYYFCTGCGTNNAACWSDCCSGTDSTNGHCTPSNCLADVCKSPDICPPPSHCEALAAPVELVICTY